MKKYLNCEESRTVDRIAINEYGIPGTVLMENAARGVAELMISSIPETDNREVCICCGKGNNAGDGLVLARWLHNYGFRPEIWFWSDPTDLQGDAAVFYAVVLKMNLPIKIARDGNDKNFLGSIERSGHIVDALLGTGMTGAPRFPFDTVINSINRAKELGGKTVWAIDLPSGLDADTGIPGVPTVIADVTCTFVSMKQGFQSPVSVPFTGKIRVLDIGVPSEIIQ